MRPATFALAAALLCAGAAAYTQPAYPIKPHNATTIKMTSKFIAQGTLTGFVNLPGRMGRGDFVVNAPGNKTAKTEVTDVGCLDTVVPPPLNWGPLWCAGREARVMQWTDEVGTLHREISIPTQPNVTANMVLWLFSPLYPQYLEFAGKMWFWYHLWHPLDHIMAASKVAPSSGNIGKPGLYTLIHEHYRNVPAEQGMPEYETDAWFHVEDMMSNFLKKRIVISINTLGLQAWTLVVNLKDTKEGLKIDVEQIIGAAQTGYDPDDPSRGAPPEAAQIVNDNLVHPMFEKFASGKEFERSLNCITRHVVEEFSMFRFFLPTVWNRFPHLQGMFALADTIGGAIPKLNYGPFMKMPTLNAAGLTQLMMPLNRTALHNFGQLQAAVKKVPGAVSSGLMVNAQSNLASLTKSINSLVAASSGPNAATNVAHAAIGMKVPSFAGELRRKAAAAPAPAAANATATAAASA